MNNNRRLISFINAGHLLDHLFLLIFPTAILGMETSFNRTYDQLLVLAIGGFIAFGAGAIPAGWLGDRWSRRHLLAIFFIGLGCAGIFTGLSSGPVSLAIGLTLIGLFAAIYHPVGTSMLVAHATDIGRTLGINGVWGNLGVALSALAAGALTEFFGWRYAFFIPGVVALVIGIFFVFLVPNSPVVKKALKPRNTEPMPRIIVIRAMSVLILVTAAGGMTFNGITVALPKIFAEKMALLGASPLGIGGIIFVIYLFGAAAQILIGRLLDRFPVWVVFLPLAALQAPLFLLLAGGHQDWVLLAGCVGIVFAIFGQVTINDAMVAYYISDEWRSRLYAVRYFVGFAVSAVAVTAVSSLYAGGKGFTPLFQILAIFGGVILVGAVFFPRVQSRKTHPQSGINSSESSFDRVADLVEQAR